MAVELTLEQLSSAAGRLSDPDYTETIQNPETDTFNTSHEYELHLSESLTFLYNLLYDDKSALTKTDILSILNSLKERENNLRFSITSQKSHTNVQGVQLSPSLRRKFYQDRARIGNFSWFRNVSYSRESAINVSTNPLAISACY